mmetsp:Transcript_9313/g.15969  ORF Transcript_9313/g.15969 Transcript_9313/m.15969 type:complete len:229 (+) Transcript_9313:160-846(+)
MKWPVWTLLIRCSLASVLAEPRTKPEPSLREFRDPNGRLFRLNLKTGATEWEDEKSQRSGEPGHAELEDWLGGSDSAAEEVRQDLALDLGMRPTASLRGEKRPGQASTALKSLKAKETKSLEPKMLESQADKTSVKRSGSVVTATSRQVRDRAWAQAQHKEPESKGSKTEPGITARHGSSGIHGAHGTNGVTGAFTNSDRELLNRGKKLLAKLEKEELDAVAREKPLK